MTQPSRRAALRLSLGAAAIALAPPLLPRARAQAAAVGVVLDPSLETVMAPVLPRIQRAVGRDLMLGAADVNALMGTHINRYQEGPPKLVHDVIVVAGRGSAAKLVEADLVETPLDWAEGGLALVAQPGSAEPAAVTSGMDFSAWVGKEGLFSTDQRPMSVVDPDRDPLGDMALRQLRAVGWRDRDDKALAFAPSMSAVLDRLARGEAVLGVAHAHAAAADGRVRVVGPLPTESTGPVVFQVAVRQGLPPDAPAREFVHALYDPQVSQVLRDAGLIPLMP